MLLHLSLHFCLLRHYSFAAQLDVPADAEVISKLIYDVGQISGVRVYQRMASCPADLVQGPALQLFETADGPFEHAASPGG